jgi:hypothetical protein
MNTDTLERKYVCPNLTSDEVDTVVKGLNLAKFELERMAPDMGHGPGTSQHKQREYLKNWNAIDDLLHKLTFYQMTAKMR